MGKYDELLKRILSGTSDANIRFDELCQLLLRLGFVERTRGSHHIFRRQGVDERVTLQRQGANEPYQVRQVRTIMTRYKLGESR